MFNQFKKILTEVNNVYGIEKQLYSDRFQTAGTVDLVAEYKGKVSVIDWKTSKRSKTIEEIPSYFIQTSFYALCMFEKYKIVVPNLVIAMAVEEERNPIVFVEPTDKWIPEFIKARKKFKELAGY